MNSKMSHWTKDLNASLVVFLVAVPLCLGIAVACGVSPIAGLISGVIGGIVVGLISGSQISVSGPAAGLTAIVIASIEDLGSFELFLLATIFAGIFQVIIGFLKAGDIAKFFPSSVINGLLASIGIIIILKQIPHAFGDDLDVEGDFGFFQKDGQNTLSELLSIFDHVEPAAIIISVLGLLIMFLWNKTPFSKSFLQNSFVVVLMGIAVQYIFNLFLPAWALSPTHLVEIPDMKSLDSIAGAIGHPNFSQWNNPKVIAVGAIIAFVASLETLLNLEAVDKIDPHRRVSPPNRELIAQGIGNIFCGLGGGLPVTSVIVRSSVNLHAGAQSKFSAIMHGFLILICVLLFPNILNLIPLSALAAVLIYAGVKLANKDLFVRMYKLGWNQFIPFIITVFAIYFTDLMIGMGIGLVVSFLFVIKNSYKSSFTTKTEMYYKENVMRIKLHEQINFFHKAKLSDLLEEIPSDTKVIIDGSNTNSIDDDVLELLNDFVHIKGPERNILVDLQGFRKKFNLEDDTSIYTTTKEVQTDLSPDDIIQILKNGNKRFVEDNIIEVDIQHQIKVTSESQHPLAIVLGCIDSRSAPEFIFDMSIGDIFSVRLAGNVANEDVLASLEFACKVLGAKVIVILGHTECGAIKGACDHVQFGNLPHLLNRIQPAIDMETMTVENRSSKNKEFVKNVTKYNVLNGRTYILEKSEVLREMYEKGEVKFVCGLHHLKSGEVEFL
ncbi:MAG: bifunctional SulP family inorganic anion transporter/carbonic anhydrase [Bacteroidetes bacterium]|nr:bifunctional SulP family inorganic anion transporter/carbonic anhydrase [Bacteroidota bacterium]